MTAPSEKQVVSLSKGAVLIATERQRQMSEENYTAEHDDKHERNAELVSAARCYLTPPEIRASSGLPLAIWPWPKRYWKPTPDDRIRELVKAGALIAAEIDRLQRLQQ